MKKKNHVIEIVMANITNIKNSSTGNFRKSYVVPGHIKVDKEDEITWEARDSDATFFFPKPEIFNEKKMVHIVGKGSTLTLPISKNADRGRYSYAVYTDNDDFAEGGSFPKIIIK